MEKMTLKTLKEMNKSNQLKKINDVFLTNRTSTFEFIMKRMHIRYTYLRVSRY